MSHSFSLLTIYFSLPFFPYITISYHFSLFCPILVFLKVSLSSPCYFLYSLAFLSLLSSFSFSSRVSFFCTFLHGIRLFLSSHHSFSLPVFLSLGNCSNHALPSPRGMICPQLRLPLLVHNIANSSSFHTTNTTVSNKRKSETDTQTDFFNNKCLLLQLLSSEDFPVSTVPGYLSSQSKVWEVPVVHVNNNDHTSYSGKSFINKTCYIASTVRFWGQKANEIRRRWVRFEHEVIRDKQYWVCTRNNPDDEGCESLKRRLI